MKQFDSNFRSGRFSLSSVAGWSSLVARQAHNLKVAGSNPAPAPNLKPPETPEVSFFQGLTEGQFPHWPILNRQQLWAVLGTQTRSFRRSFSNTKNLQA